MVIFALWFYGFGQYLSSFCFFTGAILADFSVSSYRSMFTPTPDDHPGWRNRVMDSWPIGVALVGLILGSIPPENPEYATWSRVIFNFFENYIAPGEGMFLLLTKLIVTDENDRTIASFGAIFLVFSILCSPSLQRFFAQAPFVFFGNLSFAMYLLHGIFIRVPLQWIVIYILPTLVSDAIEYNVMRECTQVELLCESWTSRFVTAMFFLVWFGLLLTSCVVWKTYIDVLGIRFAKWGEDVVTGKKKVPVDVEPLAHFDRYFGKNAGEPWLLSEKNGSIDVKKEQ